MSSFEEIWEQCRKAEAERNPEKFYQAVTLETQSCYRCGFYNRAGLRPISELGFVEEILHHELTTLPGYKADPEHRQMILRKSPEAVWCYLCQKCDKVVGWEK